MTLVRYDGPGRTLLAFGKELARGAADDFGEAEVASLQAQPHIHITILEPAAPALNAAPSPHASRPRWADHASTLGIAVTDGMSRAEIIAAVQEAAKPEAATGEGPHDDIHEQEE